MKVKVKRTKAFTTIDCSSAIFFPEDFIKFPKDAIITVAKGSISVPNKRNNAHTRRRTKDGVQ